MDTTPMYFYLASSSALWHRLLRRSCYRPVTRMGKDFTATNILNNFIKKVHEKVNVSPNLLYLRGAAITESYARFIPLLFSPYISSAGGLRPQRVQYLPQSCTAKKVAGFLLPFLATPSYSITSKYCGL
jgi:hypothetical protein